MAKIKIIATDLKTGETSDIDDLYWFEENGVHDFGGNGFYTKYAFNIIVELPAKADPKATLSVSIKKK